MTGEFLQQLLRLNLAGSAAIVLVLLLRRPVRQQFGALAAYVLWLAVPLCAAASFLPPSPEAALSPVVELTRAVARGAAPVVSTTLSFPGLLAGLWLLGALAVATLFFVRQDRFVRSLGRLAPMTGERTVLQGQYRGAGPVVLGSLRPRIVVPADFEARFDAPARQLILAHERVHLARGDAAVNGLVAVAQCLAWFNPLIHLGASRLRADQEIACDAVVIGRHPQARRAYAEALLDTLLVPRAVPFGCHWPPSAAGALKERLVMLNATSITSLRRTAGVGLASMIGVACAGAVWAATPAPHRILQPVWLSRPSMEDAVKVYPREAKAAGLSGAAVIDCRIARTGRLDNCAVRTEAPVGAGFGRASLDLSGKFQMAARSRDGQQTAGARVRIPFRFLLKP